MWCIGEDWGSRGHVTRFYCGGAIFRQIQRKISLSIKHFFKNRGTQLTYIPLYYQSTHYENQDLYLH